MRRAGHILLKKLLVGWIVCFALASFFSIEVVAAPGVQEPTQPPIPESPYGDAPLQLSIADEVCLSCHGQPGTTMTLENGDEWELYVPAEAHASSVHGEAGYACVQCHTQVGEYPHPKFTAIDARDASLKLYTVCLRCHSHQYEAGQDSAHSLAQQAGNRDAAICTDCHTAHDVRRIYQPQTKTMLLDARVWIPQTCARCHSAIFEKYKESVHGAALIGQGNPDVPTCTNCHGSHTIEDPTTAAFRLKSPEICAKCHTDAQIMDKYGLSTDVLDTYVSDFHGTTLVLFDPKTPDVPFNKPVCYDCHGVHDIASKNDPQKSLLVRENLLARCQVCHPDASINFPTSWLSHYIPSPDKYPIVYYVDLFYKFFIPITLGGMAALVALDFGRLSINRLGRHKPASLTAGSQDAKAQETVDQESNISPESGLEKTGIAPQPGSETSAGNLTTEDPSSEETSANNDEG